MKKMCLILSLMILSSIALRAEVKPTQPDGWTDGSGGIINNLAELRWLSENSVAWDESWKLGADIDATETVSWNDLSGFIPIGESEEKPFTGSFDGQGFTVSKLTINRNEESEHSGFFGYTISANIENLSILDCDYLGGDQIGGLVGSADSTIINNCHVTGKMKGQDNVAGLIGYLQKQSIISNSSTRVTITGGKDVAGFIGSIRDSKVSDCASYPNLQNLTPYRTTAGFSGYIYGSDINKCSVNGNIYGGSTVDGFATYVYHSEIRNSFAIGDVISSDTTCDTYSNFSAFVEDIEFSSSIENCYAVCNVTYGDDKAPVNSGFIGNLARKYYCPVHNNFFDSEATNQDSAKGAVAKTTAEMKNQSTFADAGWDFENIWGIDENINNGYPFLKTDYDIKPLIKIETLPDDQESRADIYAALKISFNSDVSVGEGNINLYKSDGELVESFDVIENATISANVVEVLPTNELEQLSKYYVTIDARCFLDNKGTYYGGINDSTTWNFRTVHADSAVATSPEGWTDGRGGVIYNLAELRWLSETSHAWDEDWKLVSDIDAWETKYWANESGFWPIAYYENDTAFTGSFDGQGYVISNIKIGEFGLEPYVLMYSGLFGKLSGATVENVFFENCDVQGANIGGALATTAINSTIKNCHIQGYLYSRSNAGGLVGNIDQSMVENCSFEGQVEGSRLAGGLISLAEGNSLISRSHVIASVTAGSYAGGFINSIKDSEINRCYSKGDIYGRLKVAGFVNEIENSVISNCFSIGDIYRSELNEYESFAAFYVENKFSTVENCYVVGDVVLNQGGANPTDKGFAATSLYSDFCSHNFFDAEASNQTTAIGATPKNTAEMKTESTFTDVGWDFETIWYISEEINDGYPFFIEGPSAIEEESPVISGSGLYCYPNIVSNGDIINIKTLENKIDATFYIYDIQGHLIEEVDGNKISIDDRYIRGMYFIKQGGEYCKFIVE